MALLGALGAACTTVEAPQLPTPGPDRIVGIDWRCKVQRTSDSQVYELHGANQCSDAYASAQTGNVYLTEYAKILTIRTSGGLTYTVTIDAGSSANLGDEWPPK